MVCRVCGKRAQGMYGWKSGTALVRADLCAAHARELRSKVPVVKLRGNVVAKPAPPLRPRSDETPTKEGVKDR